MQYINIPAGTTYTLVLGDDILAMNTSKIYLQCNTVGVGAINILLPKITIPAGGSIKNWFLEIFINDVGNNASANNIKITPAPSDTINGSSSQIILNTNGATGRIVITGKTSWDFNIGESAGGNPSVDGAYKTFLVPLDYTMFSDPSTLKLVPVGRLPLGYRYWGFIYRNDSLWNDAGDTATEVQLIIFDTVSNKPIDAPAPAGMTGLTLTTMLPSQQVDGSVSVGISVGVTGNCFLDTDGLQGISIQVSSNVNLNTLTKGTGSLYVIATTIPANPDPLQPLP